MSARSDSAVAVNLSCGHFRLDDIHFSSLYDRLWSDHFKDGVPKRFFPDGPRRSPYYTLAYAFDSAHELRRYAELSLVSALVDRRPVFRQGLQKSLRANAGQAENVLAPATI